MSKKSKGNSVKARRKAAAERHRNETPAVIVLSDESNDLMEAATMKIKPDTKNTEPAVSDQAAADATINTANANDGAVVDDVIAETVEGEEVTRDDVPLVGEEIPDKKPTVSEELIAEQLKNGIATDQDEPDPIEIWLVEKQQAIVGWFSALPIKLKAAHDAVIDSWIALGAKIDNAVENLYAWAYKTNVKFRAKWQERFPPLVTHKQMVDMLSQASEGYNARIDALSNQIAGKTVLIDPARLDNLLAAVKAGHKAKAVKFYSGLTNVDYGVAKAAIEALA